MYITVKSETAHHVNIINPAFAGFFLAMPQAARALALRVEPRPRPRLQSLGALHGAGGDSHSSPGFCIRFRGAAFAARSGRARKLASPRPGPLVAAHSPSGQHTTPAGRLTCCRGSAFTHSATA